MVSERDQARGPDLFTGLGVTLADKDLIIVKSSQHFHAGFAPLARVLYLDGPGSLQTDIAAYPYRTVLRPCWPLAASGREPWAVGWGGGMGQCSPCPSNLPSTDKG